MVLPLNEGLFCLITVVDEFCDMTDPVEEEGGKKCSEENKIVAKKGDIFLPLPVILPAQWRSTKKRKEQRLDQRRATKEDQRRKKLQ